MHFVNKKYMEFYVSTWGIPVHGFCLDRYITMTKQMVSKQA